MYTNAKANISEPYPLQQENAQHQQPSYAWNLQTCFIPTAHIAVHFSIDFADGRYIGIPEIIAEVASRQATPMYKMKPLCLYWGLIHLTSVVFILGPASMDPEIPSLKHLWLLHSCVADMARPNLIMLRMVISEFAKGFERKTDWIPPPEMVNSITYDQLDVA